jgi:AbrB family looped-hinge helix DNA binding protein
MIPFRTVPSRSRGTAVRGRAWRERRRLCGMLLSYRSLTRDLTMERTRLSSKGQVILPKRIREAQSWQPGTEFIVESSKDGVLLRPIAVFPRTAIDDVAGCLASKRKAAGSSQMRKAIEVEVRRRHDRGRY